MDMEERQDPEDQQTMSLAACLNRIMIKVSREGYNEETIEELKENLAYVCGKFNICNEGDMFHEEPTKM